MYLFHEIFREIDLRTAQNGCFSEAKLLLETFTLDPRPIVTPCQPLVGLSTYMC